MATYYVTLNRPTVEAASPEEATAKCLTDPLGSEDQFFVKEIPANGSMFYVPGAAVAVGGVVPQPDEIYKGPGLVPQLKKGK